jgi:PAS domain S-box-containing protein
MVLYDPETFLVLETNQQACQLYGIPREEFEGTFLEERIAPEEWARLEERLRRAIVDPRVHIVSRMVHRRGDGSTFPVQVASVNITQQGKSRRLAVLRDLTDTEIAEASLRSLRVAAESGGRPLLILDRGRRIAFSNPAASDLTGYSAEELHGQDPRLIVSHGFEEAVWRGLEQAEAGHTWTGKVAVEPPGGGARITDTDILPVMTIAGNVTHFVMVLRDAPSSRPFGDFVAPVPEAKDFFVGLLSQPLSQGLAAIQASVEQVMASPELPDELRPDVKSAVEQSTVTLHLVREFEWVLSKHTQAGAPAPGSAVDVIEAALGRTRDAIGERDLDVRRDVRVAQGAAIRAPILMGEALVRIFNHAVATDTAQAVSLEFSLVEVNRNGAPHLRLRIAGNGGPRTEEERARLFAYPSAGKSAAPSLCVARLLIEILGGAVHAENRKAGDPAQGTAIVVTLPATA